MPPTIKPELRELLGRAKAAYVQVRQNSVLAPACKRRNAFVDLGWICFATRNSVFSKYAPQLTESL